MRDTNGTESAPAFLLVEDDLLVGRVVSGALAPHAITWVTTCQDARQAFASRRWTGVILDVRLPDGSGLELLGALRAGHDLVPALVMTAAYDPRVANRAHELRASCVYKPEIMPNVRLFMQRSIAARGDAQQRTAAAARELASACELTAREAELVELIAIGVSRESLALELGISENTLKTMVRRVLVKTRESRVEGVARAVLESIVQLSCAADVDVSAGGPPRKRATG